MILTHNLFSKQAKKIIFWTAAAIVCVLIARQFAIGAENATTVSLIAFLALLVSAKPMIGLYIIALLPLVGELYRLPYGPESGLLISDVFIGVYFAIWFIKKILSKTPFPKNGLNRPFLIFISVALLSLLQALIFLKPVEVMSGSLYLIRFFEYTALFILVSDAIKTAPSAKKLAYFSIVAALLIAIAGFIQLVIYPDLNKLEELGWDPHINRLVSTWLDPNFVGGLMAFATSLLLGVTLYARSAARKFGLLLLTAIMGAALFFTYSRSAYLAVAVSVLLIGLLKSRKLLIAAILIFLIAVNISPRTAQRVEDLVHSAQSLIFNTAENPDATARLRIKSWEQTLEIVYTRPILGSGYNTLRYVNYNEGFVSDTAIHSAGGSDSSFLTILATTGILGLIPFLWLYWNSLVLAWKTWRAKKTPSFFRGYGLGVFAGTLGLITHSIFVNSLVFPQIGIFFWISIGILEWHRRSVIN